jgi:hypothetical protein
MLGILRPQLALEDVWRGSRAADAHARDVALELVETLPPAIRARLLAALQRTSDETRLRAMGGQASSFAEAMAAMVRDESAQLRELASALAGRVAPRA